jgi:hypothetical protein
MRAPYHVLELSFDTTRLKQNFYSGWMPGAKRINNHHNREGEEERANTTTTTIMQLSLPAGSYHLYHILIHIV